MRVLIVNTSERTGGAAVAAHRLMDALNDNGVKTMMLVRDKQTDDICVASCGSSIKNKWNFIWERVVIWWHNRLSRQNLFKISIANTGIDITKTREFEEADIIHLHWINQGMLSLKGIRKILQSGKPVVWTMHDMWPLTAICHHAYECQHYVTACHDCPFLQHPNGRDLSHKVFRKKQRLLSSHGSAGMNLTFVAVSDWLAERARQSALTGHFQVKVIPNALSLHQFTIIDRIDARSALKIKEPYVIVFGAARIDDPIKGMDYLIEALQRLTDSGRVHASDIRLLLFGNLRNPEVLTKMPVPYTYLGYINDTYKQSEIYSASNATVSSSLYETFGQTLIEAMACGSIPVSFDGSGQTSIISHLKNGFLASRLSAESLAEGIEWALRSNLSAQELRRSVIRHFAESVVANHYINLYQSIVQE